MRWWILVSFILLPTPIFAAITINEVAWMGSSVSANHEWIELFNSGGAVVVDGWTISDGMNLSITLAGTIPGNSYAVLERSSDDSAPGTAFFTYTGALVNTGATLTLKRADGSIEDQVGGGDNWLSIGGDNATKETAQYTTSGWITAAATPGQHNQTSGTPPITNPPPSPPPASATTTTNTSPGSSNSTNPQNTTRRNRDASETVRLELPANTLTLTVDAQSVGYVNQEIRFEATPAGIGRSLAHSIVYRWNFGDGSIAFGKEPTHYYQFPGTYVVTLYASVGTQEHLSRHEITILPISVSLSHGPGGEIQINNDSPYEIDLSGYQVKGGKDFMFPQYTILLPNQTITLPSSRVGLVGQPRLPMLYDSRIQPVLKTVTPARITTASVQTAATEIVTPLKSTPRVQATPITSRFGFATTTSRATEPVAAAVEENNATPTVISLTATETTSSSPGGASEWPYYVFIGLLLGALGVMFLKPKEVVT